MNLGTTDDNPTSANAKIVKARLNTESSAVPGGSHEGPENPSLVQAIG